MIGLLYGGATLAANSTIDLSLYKLVGRYDLPEPTRTTAPAHNLLAQEVSAVTYDWDTDTLFVAGDGSTAIVQVSKTGQLINTMTLAQGSSPLGTAFYDIEGLTRRLHRVANRWTLVPTAPGFTAVTLTTTVEIGANPVARVAERAMCRLMTKQSDVMLAGLSQRVEERR
jgi:hypothetical protein